MSQTPSRFLPTPGVGRASGTASECLWAIRLHTCGAGPEMGEGGNAEMARLLARHGASFYNQSSIGAPQLQLLRRRERCPPLPRPLPHLPTLQRPNARLHSQQQSACWPSGAAARCAATPAGRSGGGAAAAASRGTPRHPSTQLRTRAAAWRAAPAAAAQPAGANGSVTARRASAAAPAAASTAAKQCPSGVPRVDMHAYMHCF